LTEYSRLTEYNIDRGDRKDLALWKATVIVKGICWMMISRRYLGPYLNSCIWVPAQWFKLQVGETSRQFRLVIRTTARHFGALVWPAPAWYLAGVQLTKTSYPQLTVAVSSWVLLSPHSCYGLEHDSFLQDRPLLCKYSAISLASGGCAIQSVLIQMLYNSVILLIGFTSRWLLRWY